MKDSMQWVRPFGSYLRLPWSKPYRLFSSRFASTSSNDVRDFVDDPVSKALFRPSLVEITRPVRWVRLYEQKKDRQRQKKLQEIQDYGMDKEDTNARVVVRCRNKSLNHYNGQRYPNTELSGHMASEFWYKTGSKNKGDYFVIHPTGKNPSKGSSETLEDVPETFRDLKYAAPILSAIDQIGFRRPTVVQAKASFPCLSGHNVLVAAETGCGKTVAYAAPLLHLLHNREPTSIGNRPTVIILAPSQELTYQLYLTISKLAQHMPSLSIHCTSKLVEPPLTEEMAEQETEEDDTNEESVIETDVMHRAHIVIGTPGSLLKAKQDGRLRVGGVSLVVLDEADTLLDDSFSDDVYQLLDGITFRSSTTSPEDKTQLILVSATLPSHIDDAMATIVDPKSVFRCVSQHLHRLQPHVRQMFIRMNEADKMDRLLHLLLTKNAEGTKTLVFTKNAETTRYVCGRLKKANIETVSLCKKFMPLQRRRMAIRKLIDGDFAVFVATDLASRGIDFKVNRVVNYDFPRHLCDYVHRVGRVGRVSTGGRKRNIRDSVINFVRNKREVHLTNIIETCARTDSPVPDMETNVRREIEQHDERKLSFVGEYGC